MPAPPDPSTLLYDSLTAPASAQVSRQPGPTTPDSDVADLVVAIAWGAARLSARVAANGIRITAPVVGIALRPPLVPRRLQPGYAVQLLVEQWQRDRPEALRALRRWSATAVPGAVDATLAQVDVERVVTVVLDRVDLDVLVADIVRRLDLDAVVTTALARVHLAPMVSAALDQLDLTQLVLDRVDLERVINDALERLDLTSIVVDQVDLGSVIAAAVQRVDLTAMVLQQVDLIGVAEYVVEGIDLPEIIRDSTGSVASEAVRGLRMQGVDADAVVGRVVDRILHRRRQHRDEETPV